jgi:AcrR family transcriptional regulator
VSNYSLLLMNKKENILQVALQLFASQGFDNTSTSLIAKKAEVSEGLIFRHFGSKEGLLNEILNEGFTKIGPYIEVVMMEKDPEKSIFLTLELPYKIISEQKEFWKLQINLRQQNDKFRKEFDENVFFAPFNSKIEKALKALKFPNPKLETDLFFITLTGLGLYLLDNDNKANAYKLINSIASKYSK